ncbi:MAG: uracil phosphoribosyltransferase [Acidobacteriota bacterium]
MYSSYVAVHLVTHPIAQHALLRIRHASTTPSEFRRLASRLAAIIALEATRDLATQERTVDTPLESTTGHALATDVAVVPVLRAGLSMVDAVLSWLPEARVGHVGLQRDEATAIASRYYLKLPAITARTTVLVVDPMLATGGSAEAAIDLVKAVGAVDVRLLSIVAAPEGVAYLQSIHPDVPIFTTAVDRQLNAQKYILPGLGDFGDRLYGT